MPSSSANAATSSAQSCSSKRGEAIPEPWQRWSNTTTRPKRRIICNDGYHVNSPVHASECSKTNVGPPVVGPESTTYVLPRLESSTTRPCGRRPTGATSGSVNDGSGNVILSGPRSASITQYGVGKPDAVVAEGPQMVSWGSRRDTLRRNMLGRKMPVAASRRGNAREASCRTLSLIVGAPHLSGRQEHSEHEAMFIARAAAHESSRLLDSAGSSTRNTQAPPGFLFVGGVTPPSPRCFHS